MVRKRLLERSSEKQCVRVTRRTAWCEAVHTGFPRSVILLLGRVWLAVCPERDTGVQGAPGEAEGHTGPSIGGGFREQQKPQGCEDGRGRGELGSVLDTGDRAGLREA